MPRSRSTKRDIRTRLSEWAEEQECELLFFDPPHHFDHAIVGLVVGFQQEPAVLYDRSRVLAAMAKDLGEEGAEEWFEFNTIGAYLGPHTPRFLIRREDL